MRIGNGFDTHRLVVGRAFILGGVHIPYELGLEGHSDGDALSHAIIDALLGAAGLGDIGMWFPPNDPQWGGADSLELLKKVKATLVEHQFKIVNIDSVIICERPRLSPFFTAMREKLAKALDMSPELVSVKATTAEGMGSIGRGEALAVQAVALVDSVKFFKLLNE